MGIKKGKRKEKNSKESTIKEYLRIQDIIARKNVELQKIQYDENALESKKTEDVIQQIQEERQEFKERIKEAAQQEEKQEELELSVYKRLENYDARRAAEEADEKRRNEYMNVVDRLLQEREF